MVCILLELRSESFLWVIYLAKLWCFWGSGQSGRWRSKGNIQFRRPFTFIFQIIHFVCPSSVSVKFSNSKYVHFWTFRAAHFHSFRPYSSNSLEHSNTYLKDSYSKWTLGKLGKNWTIKSLNQNKVETICLFKK